MRSPSEEQTRPRRRSHSRTAGPRSSPSARRSTIAARRGPLSSTSSVGITYTGGPSGRRVKRQCKRSVSLAAKLPSGRKPASVTLLTISCSSGRANASRTAGHCVSATRSEEHTSELQSRLHLVCRLLLEKKKNTRQQHLY